ncbi:MAG: aldo/keto reductase [Coriobacteriales bacterium]|jgi:predicted aldo/keto reductase-like oxidoreductase|nr:aldo/keto reductase [Coriobacteriales bacterium]
MKKVRFGRTELQVSKIALGGIPLQRLTKAEAIAVVHESLALGINFIDTANFYLDSEEKIGAAIRGIPRQELVLSTKSLGQTAADLTAHLNNSLKLLGVDYVDIFHLHSVSTPERLNNVFKENGTFEWLQEQVKAGKVRFPAFSSHRIDLALQLMETNRFDVVQLPFNYVDQEGEEAINLARQLDLGFICMKPLGGGRLTDAGSAFRFLMQYDNLVPNPGIETLEEIREIAAIVASNASLTLADETEIARVRAELGTQWCHKCDYCQPCLQGVQISGALTVECTFKRYNVEGARLLIDRPVESARACTECGDCLPRCPYQLNIPQLLKENIAFYDSIVT